MINRVAGAIVLVLTAVLTGCTASGEDGSSSAPATTTASTTGGAATTAPSTTAGSSAPAGLARVEGSYVLAGRSADSALLYRITGGRAVRVSSATGISSVSVSGTTVVVGRDTADAESVVQLRDGKPVGLRIAGFGPAVSGDSELAWVALGASTTPGISKPGGSILRVRPSLTGPDRVLARYPGSISAPVWVDDDLVVAVADDDMGDGTSARIVRFADGRGTGRTVATVANADALELTGGDDAITVATDGGAEVVTLRDGRTHGFARGWDPLCWFDDDSVLASQGGRLATVPVSDTGTVGTPRVLGRLPEGFRAFGGACGD